MLYIVNCVIVNFYWAKSTKWRLRLCTNTYIRTQHFLFNCETIIPLRSNWQQQHDNSYYTNCIHTCHWTKVLKHQKAYTNKYKANWNWTSLGSLVSFSFNMFINIGVFFLNSDIYMCIKKSNEWRELSNVEHEQLWNKRLLNYLTNY